MTLNPLQILFRLQDNGFESYFVGGYVRDMLRGVENTDVDIATAATPDQISTLFSDQEIKEIQGNRFKVLLVNGTEVATFRKDVYYGKSSKNCEISYGTLKDDAVRRDLTVNALYLDPFTKEFIDMVGGKKDLESKVIRLIDDPSKRIYEDPDRIIRACRFLALIDGIFEEKTKCALIELVEMVRDDVEPGRIRIEIMKAMKIKETSKFFQALFDIDALQYIFPSLDRCQNIKGGKWHGETVWEHNMMVGDSISTKFPLLKLSGYLHDVGKPIAMRINPETQELWFKGHEDFGVELLLPELKNLRFSNEEISYITNLTRFHMRMPHGMGPKATRRLLKDLQEVSIPWKDLVRLRLADKVGNLREDVDRSVDSAKELVKKFWTETRRPKNLPLSVKDLEVNGLDVMEVLDIKPGPSVGKVLNELLELVLDDPDKNIRETLLDEIKRRKSI